MAKKPRIADPDAIRAARNAIAEARRALNNAKLDTVTTIVTGVPRPGRDPDTAPKWKPVEPPFFPPGIGPRAESKPKPPIEPEPRPPREMKYVWIQTRAPRSDNDCGEIKEAQYGVAEGILYLEDINGKPIASQKLRDDDNPLHVAARLLRDKGRNNSSVAGFYADIPNNGRETYH